MLSQHISVSQYCGVSQSSNDSSGFFQNYLFSSNAFGVPVELHADVMTLYVFVLLKVFRLSRFLLRSFF